MKEHTIKNKPSTSIQTVSKKGTSLSPPTYGLSFIDNSPLQKAENKITAPQTTKALAKNAMINPPSYAAIQLKKSKAERNIEDKRNKIYSGTVAVPKPSVPDARQLKFYEVNVDLTSKKEIRDAINLVQPTDPADNHKVDAYTSWDIGWKNTNEVFNHRENVVINKLEVLLPWLKPVVGLIRPSVYIAWKEYIHKLAAHEGNHASAAIRARENMENAIRHGDQAGAQARGNEAYEQAKQWDRDYDAATNHGQTEGATFG